MNSYEISKILKNNPITKSSFLGVYARDELPIIYKLPCSFILNTHTSDKPGEHWLAFYYNKEGQATFFDPTGISPNYYKLDSYLDKTSKNWVFNKTRVQSFFSETCGHYCVFFIYFKSNNMSLLDILSYFTKNLKENDKKVKNFIKFFI